MTFDGETHIIIRVGRVRRIRLTIAELCNGSTHDSDSCCLGSNPSSAASISLHGQAVKTSPSHGENWGSSPHGGTNHVDEANAPSTFFCVFHTETPTLGAGVFCLRARNARESMSIRPASISPPTGTASRRCGGGSRRPRRRPCSPARWRAPDRSCPGPARPPSPVPHCW